MKTLTQNKQIIYLFLSNFAILFAGLGIFPLLPLHAAEFGANSSMIGIYMAVTYIAISIGSIVPGKLSDKLPRKLVFQLAGLVGIPSLILLGQAKSFWQVVVLTALTWFIGGVGLSIANVMTGLNTTASTRGKIFGLMSMATPMGALIGGIAVGQLVQRFGYPTMFAVTAVVWSLFPIMAIWKIEDKPQIISKDKKSMPASTFHLNSGFLLLLSTVLLASMTVSIARLGLSLSMKAGHFTASDISTASAFGGLVTIPVTLAVGIIADKFGRKTSLIFGYLLAAGSALVLMGAYELWQFWVASFLVLIGRNIISSMSSAFATDLLDRDALGRALPLVGTVNWAAGAMGFAGTGFLMDLFGAPNLYRTATMIAILAVFIATALPAGLERLRARPAMEAASK